MTTSTSANRQLLLVIGVVAVIAGLIALTLRLSSPAAGPQAGQPAATGPGTGAATAGATTAATTTAVPPLDAPADLAAVRAAIAKPGSVVVILGDSTGDERQEWPDLWTAGLADRQTRLHLWTRAHRYDPRPVVRGSGPALEVWNCSYPGSTTDYQLDRLAECIPTRPDAIILSHSHNLGVQTIVPGVDELLRAVYRSFGPVPTAITLQNPRFGHGAASQAQTVGALRSWATRGHWPVIDVYAAWASDGTPAMVPDGVHPDAAGQALWARVVAQTLTP